LRPIVDATTRGAKREDWEDEEGTRKQKVKCY